MVIDKGLQCSEIDLDRWRTPERELLGIRLQKPDQRHKSLVLINAYIHPGTHKTKASWEFLEEMEDQLGDTIMICGDLNARSRTWDTQGTNPQGTALDEALQDCLLSVLATTTPTHQATRAGDTDSTIDLALISPRLTAWAKAETLGPHESDHLPVVFSLQKPAQQQRVRTQNPFRYNKKGPDTISTLRRNATSKKAHKQGNTTRQQPPWWNKETEAAWHAKRAAVKAWQIQKRNQLLDPEVEPGQRVHAEMKARTEEFKQVAREAKATRWKSFCEKISADTTLTQFWNFYQQMEGATTAKTTPDLHGPSGQVLKTNGEKGEALLVRFIEQSDQKNVADRKSWLSSMNAQIERMGNDDSIMQHELTEALARCKNTAPGPDKVKNADIRNLPEEEKVKLFQMYEESLKTGIIPDDWTHSYLKALPKPGKDHRQLNGYRILTMQNTVGKLMESIIARKLTRDLEQREILPPNQGGFRPGKSTWENAAAFAYDVYEGFQRKQQTLAVAIDLEDAYNRVDFQTLMDLLQQLGVNQTIVRWIGAALLERTVVMRFGDWSSTIRKITMGLPQGSPLSPVLYNVYTKGLADLDKNGPARVLILADDGLIYKTTEETNQAVEAVQKQLNNTAQWCQETNSSINASKAQALWCTLDNKAAGQGKTSCQLQRHGH